ncbi:ComF family protein [Candidatus Minimicrobia naudis]
MFDTLLSIIAPHHCYKCGKTGGILCLDCKKYITSRKYDMCVLCGDLLENGNLCKKHKLPCDMIWCFSRRTGVVAKIIDDYKFNRVQAAAGLLSEFLDEALPELPPDTVIVPIPTISKNIRRRGFDHIRKIAIKLSRRRKIECCSLLRRRNNVTQHFTKSSARENVKQRSFLKLRVKLIKISDISLLMIYLQLAQLCWRRRNV